jgi:hypothetical protein
MEWMKALKNIGVFRSKIQNLKKFLDTLIEHGCDSYQGFRIESTCGIYWT